MSVCVTACQKGAGLVEVLVALLVFSIGAYAALGVQLAAKRNTFEAAQRTIATGLAGDLLARIRANPTSLSRYAISELVPASASDDGDCYRIECTPAELAERDIDEWAALLGGFAEMVGGEESAVPSGGLVYPRACVTISDSVVSLEIAWRGSVPQARTSVPERSTPKIGRGACGDSAGIYGEGNRFRRTLLMASYVDNS